jgi:hypothetical protein
VTAKFYRQRKKGKRLGILGKKKRYTIKTQLIVNGETGEIICTAHTEGKMRDFNYKKRVSATPFQMI